MQNLSYVGIQIIKFSFPYTYTRKLTRCIKNTRAKKKLTKLECGERRGVEAEPEVLALAQSGEDGLSDESRLEIGGGDAIDDLGVIVHGALDDPLPQTVLFQGQPSHLYLRQLRHCFLLPY